MSKCRYLCAPMNTEHRRYRSFAITAMFFTQVWIWMQGSQSIRPTYARTSCWLYAAILLPHRWSAPAPIQTWHWVALMRSWMAEYADRSHAWDRESNDIQRHLRRTTGLENIITEASYFEMSSTYYTIMQLQCRLPRGAATVRQLITNQHAKLEFQWEPIQET